MLKVHASPFSLALMCNCRVKGGNALAPVETQPAPHSSARHRHRASKRRVGARRPRCSIVRAILCRIPTSIRLVHASQFPSQGMPGCTRYRVTVCSSEIAPPLSKMRFQVMAPLVHLIYASTATQGFDQTELIALLRKARTANAQVVITGMLLYVAGNFFQVLEGEQPAVEAQFAKIMTDPRHTNVVTIIKEPLAKRSFGDWTMAFAEISREEFQRVDGLNDFFAEGSMLAQLGSGRAKKLVTAFGQGSWRARIIVAKQSAA